MRSFLGARGDSQDDDPWGMLCCSIKHSMISLLVITFGMQTFPCSLDKWGDCIPMLAIHFIAFYLFSHTPGKTEHLMRRVFVPILAMSLASFYANSLASSHGLKRFMYSGKDEGCSSLWEQARCTDVIDSDVQRVQTYQCMYPSLFGPYRGYTPQVPEDERKMVSKLVDRFFTNAVVRNRAMVDCAWANMLPFTNIIPMLICTVICSWAALHAEHYAAALCVNIVASFFCSSFVSGFVTNILMAVGNIAIVMTVKRLREDKHKPQNEKIITKENNIFMAQCMGVIVLAYVQCSIESWLVLSMIRITNPIGLGLVVRIFTGVLKYCMLILMALVHSTTTYVGVSRLSVEVEKQPSLFKYCLFVPTALVLCSSMHVHAPVFVALFYIQEVRHTRNNAQGAHGDPYFKALNFALAIPDGICVCMMGFCESSQVVQGLCECMLSLVGCFLA